MNYALLLTLITVVNANNWDTYPQVPKTASINGFADPIYSDLPKCAQQCVKVSTSNTPCPYWDTGCLCVMPQWSGEVAQCIAEACSGSDVASATSLAYELCSSVGANVWMMPASITAALTKAAGDDKVNTADASAEAEWATADSSDLTAEATSSADDEDSKSDKASDSVTEAKSTDSTSSAKSTDSSSESSSSSSSSASETSSGKANSVQLTGGLFSIVLGMVLAIM